MKKEKVEKKKATKKQKKKELPVVLVRLGDKQHGWIPSVDHANAFVELIQKMGLDKRYYFIVYHYGIELELLDKSKTLKDCGIQIVDQDKFEDFVKESMKNIPTGTSFTELINAWNASTKNASTGEVKEEPKKPEKTKLRKVKNTVG